MSLLMRTAHVRSEEVWSEQRIGFTRAAAKVCRVV
jgi:hypothetical protein